MRAIICTLLVILISLSGTKAQTEEIPEWFLNDLQKNIGTWKADNKEYISEDELFDAYVVEWKWGIGKTSMIGSLYALTGKVRSDEFWQFRQYWDNENQKGMLVQYGNYGVIGIGEHLPDTANYMQTIQVFSMPNGTKWQEKHLSSLQNDILTTHSFSWNGSQWVPNRTYKWFKLKDAEK